MFVIRWLLGRIILLINFITSPRSPKLTVQQQQDIADKVSHISLYQLAACPFCVKVRRAMKRQGIQLPLVDIKAEQGRFREELIQATAVLVAQIECIDRHSKEESYL